jgi:hypothetical protein
MSELKLLDKVRTELRTKHYSRKTEVAYTNWIKRFVLFHNKRHPNEMGAAEIKSFIQDVRLKRTNLLLIKILSHVLNNLVTNHHVSIQPVRYE